MEANMQTTYINRDYDNLSQRGVAYFLATFPSFYPVDAPDASREEQEAAYRFIRSVYTRLYDDPSLLGFKHAPDDCFRGWEKQSDKPGLAGKIRGVIRKIEEFVALLYRIALDGAVVDTLKPAQVRQLAKFAIPPEAAKGLALLAKISAERVAGDQRPYLTFSRGVFDVTAPWTQEVFGNMLSDRVAFDRLADFLTESGYRRVDGRSEENQMAAVTLDFVREYAETRDKLKWAWAERTRGGIEVIYEELREVQPLYSMRIPYFAELLRHAELASTQVRDFICAQAKKCDNCRYCVQTDKTGTKPLAFVPVGEFPICPLFCGFQFRWRTLDDDAVGNIIALLGFVDEVFRPGGVGEAALRKWAK